MSRRAVWPFVLAGLALAAVLLVTAERWRAWRAPLKPMLPVAFDHADHSKTPCAQCHHNFTDNTGSGPCYYCHKNEPEIAMSMEKMFHDFCFDCHVDKRAEGEDSGPMRECGGCHQQ